MSLIKSGAALAFARLANQAVMFIGPIILVRLISVYDYGIYREFFVYATIAGIIGSAAVNRSLLYLLPKHPDSERQLVALSTLFVMFSSLIVALSVFGIDRFTELFSGFEFGLEVAIYLIVFLNFDYVECYWLVKNQIRKVIIYTLVRSAARLLAVVGAAYYYGDAATIIWSLIAVESIRLFYVVLSTLFARSNFRDRVRQSGIAREQLVFFSPLAIMASLETVNVNLGQLIVSDELGEEALAFYFVGSYAILIASLLYSSVSDLLFPKVVGAMSDNSFESLTPWRQMTNFYVAFMLAVTALGFVHANEIIGLLFSDKYLAAAPVFQVLIFGTLILSFDFNFVIRTLNKNTNSLVGYLILIPINLGISYALIAEHGLLAPAYAYLLAQACLTIYLGWRVILLTKLSFLQLFDWSQLSRISLAFLGSIAVLVMYTRFAGAEGLIHAIISSVLFLAVYLLLLGLVGFNALNYFGKQFGANVTTEI